MEALIKALIKAKQEFGPVKKDKNGARAKYATLDAVLSAVEPALHKHGLMIAQAMDCANGGNFLTTTLWHESGQFLSSTYELPANTDSQKMGSAITYGRRYTICALLSIVADEDDDGEDSSDMRGAQSKSNNKPPANKPKAAPVAPKQEVNGVTPTTLADKVKGITSDAKKDGLTVAEIKAICEANNLPTAPSGFKTQAQVDTLASELQDAIADKRGQFEPAGPDEGDAVYAQAGVV